MSRSRFGLQVLLFSGVLLTGLLTASNALAQEQGQPSGEVEAAEEGENLAETGEVAPVWRWINFGLLAVGLGYVMGRYLPPVFRSRTTEIQKDIAEARRIKQDAEQRAADMEARMRALGTEIDAFKEQAGQEMRQEGERIRTETATQIGRVEAQTAAEIEAATKHAQRELRQYSAELALKLAEERLRSRLDAAGQAALVDGFLTDLEQRGANN